MHALRTYIRIKTPHCVLLVFMLMGLPTAALAEILPLKLTQNLDQSVSLSIHGETHPLQLNQTFTHNTPTPFHVKGTVGGNANHRIALTVHTWPNDVVGSFNMNNQWYQIESRTSAARNLGSLATDSELIALQPDVNLVSDNARGAIDIVLSHQSLTKKILSTPSLTNQTLTNKHLTQQPVETRAIAGITTRAIRVGIIVDSLFNDHHSGRGLARATTVMNGVDAILRRELGLAVEVVSIVDYTNSANDPFRRLESSIDTTLMPALQAERVRNNALSGDLSLVHLFSGHLDQNTQTLVGLGWLNSVCNSNGFDVSLSSPFLFDTLLAAHEIMHNLGAPHDNSTECAVYSGVSDTQLMWSNINGSTTSGLSACSIGTARASLAADCTVDAIDMSVAIRLSTQANTTSHELAILVSNTDTRRTVNNVTTRTHLPANTIIQALPSNCELSAVTLTCQHGSIPPSQQKQTLFSIETSHSTDSRVRSEVSLNTDVDHNLINNVAVLNLPSSASAASANGWVTVSTNTVSVNSAVVSTSVAANNDSETNAPINALAQASSSENRFLRFGATSMGLIWTLLLATFYRLVFTINRVKRNRL